MRYTYGMFRVLFTPSCWIQNHQYSEDWDRRLRKLMMQHSFKPLDNYRAELGGIKMWIANHPYASFHIDEDNFRINVRARRITILEAGDKYIADSMERVTRSAQG